MLQLSVASDHSPMSTGSPAMLVTVSSMSSGTRPTRATQIRASRSAPPGIAMEMVADSPVGSRSTEIGSSSGSSTG